MKILQEIIIPQESVNDDKVVVLDLYFKNGDIVKNGDLALEFETSKATQSLEILQDGYIFYDCEEGDEVTVGSIVAKVYDVKTKNEELTVTLEKIISESKTFAPPTAESVVDIDLGTIQRTIFSKEAELLMLEKGLNENDFKGKDFVNANDILSFLNLPVDKIEHTKEVTKTKLEPINILNKNVHFEKISIQKKREIEYLSAVQSHGLNSSVTVFVEIEKVRNFVNSKMTLLKGSFLPIITYELAKLLRKYPKINSYFENDTVVYYNDINIGIAIDMDKGLKVLKMPKTDHLSILEIERSILDISRKYFEDKATVNDVSDITFTITDLFNSGLASFAPLINKHNSAILAISSVDEKLQRINLTVTFDHRVTEGKYVANFIFELKTRIESYFNVSVLEKKSKDPIKCYKCTRKLNDQLYGKKIVFFKVIDTNGTDQVLCSVCYEGF